VLRLPNRSISPDTARALGSFRHWWTLARPFEERVALAKAWWKKKSGRKARETAFEEVKAKLGEMAFGSVRCAYCEDSAADESSTSSPRRSCRARLSTGTIIAMPAGPAMGRRATSTPLWMLRACWPSSIRSS
jgi:hypothetical protein